MNNETDKISQKVISKERVQKSFNLSQTTVDYVTEYADMLGISFGRAAEGLILKSLNETEGLGDLLIAKDVVRREMATQFDVYAKLIVHAGLEAGAAKEAAQAVYFQTLREMSENGNLEDAIGVDPDTEKGQEIIGLHKEHKARNRSRAVEAVKNAVQNISELLTKIRMEGA